jgi:hypothetical protein
MRALSHVPLTSLLIAKWRCGRLHKPPLGVFYRLCK